MLSNQYNFNLTGAGSIGERLNSAKEEEIKELQEELGKISKVDSNKQLHKLEKIISKAGKEVADAGDEKHSDAQKIIKEKYIALQKKNIEIVEDLSLEDKAIKNKAKVVSKKLSDSEGKIDKMIKKIDHAVSKRGASLSIFNKIVYPRKTKYEVQSAREDSVRKVAGKLDIDLGFVILSSARDDVKKLNSTQQKLIGKITDLKIKHQQEKDAVEGRLELAGKIRKSIANIDNIVNQQKEASKKSSQDLKDYLENEIFPRLEEEKQKLLQFESGLTIQPYDFNMPYDEDISNEERFMEILSSGLKSSNKATAELNKAASEARSFRPVKSKLSADGRVRKSSAILSLRTPGGKELNDRLATHLKDFNRKLLAYSDSVLNEDGSSGEKFGELEVLKSKIEELKLKLGEKINSENTSNILKMRSDYAMFDNIEDTKLSALKFSYLNDIENNILIYSKNLIECLTYLKSPDAERELAANHVARAQNISTYGEYKKHTINKEMEGIDNYIQKMLSVALKHRIDLSGIKDTLDYFEALKESNSEEQIAAATDFMESKVTAESLGINIEQKYQYAFDGILQNPNMIPRVGLMESIPILKVQYLESMLKSMKRIDDANATKYNYMLKRLREIDRDLAILKDNCNFSTVEEMLNELKNVNKEIKFFIDNVEKLEFGMNENNTFYGGTEEAKSFGDINKKWLLDRLNYSSSILDGINKYAEKIEDQEMGVSQIPLARKDVEQNIPNGVVNRSADYKLSATFSGGKSSLSQFIEDSLRYFKEVEGINQPYMQIQPTNRYVYLNDEGILEKLLPSEIEERGLEFKTRDKVTFKYGWSGKEI